MKLCLNAETYIKIKKRNMKKKHNKKIIISEQYGLSFISFIKQIFQFNSRCMCKLFCLWKSFYYDTVNTAHASTSNRQRKRRLTPILNFFWNAPGTVRDGRRKLHIYVTDIADELTIYYAFFRIYLLYIIKRAPLKGTWAQGKHRYKSVRIFHRVVERSASHNCSTAEDKSMK